MNPPAGAGIEPGGGAGRAGTSHTIVSANFLASTYTGIRVSSTARKTFVLNNEFDHVETPIEDRGTRTLLQGNKARGSSRETDDDALAEGMAGTDLRPTCSPELQSMGLNYGWNEQLNGKRLDQVERPGETWLLMDFVGAHDWMVNNGYGGHRGGVNILYAGGSVKCSRPFSTEAWNTQAPQSWLQWARE